MAKSREYNFLYVILTLFVCLLPTFGSVMDEKAVIYTSFCVLLSAVGYVVYKNGSIPVTKVTVFFLIIAIAAMLQLFYVTDKGSQFAMGILFLAAAAGSVLVQECCLQLGDGMREYMLKAIYVSSLVYALSSVFFQIFIETDFLGYGMELAKGSPSAAAMLMLGGIVCAMKLFYTRRKSPMFFLSLLLLAYVFVMTKSLVGYLAGAVMVFVFAMKMRHKRVEAFLSLVVAVALAALNLGYVVFSFIASRVNLGGMWRGLGSIIGLGNGGYNALTDIFDKSNTTSVQTFAVLCEVFGVLGIVIIIIAAANGIKNVLRKPTSGNVMMLCALVIILFTPASSFVYAVILLGMCYSVREDIIDVPVKRIVGAVAVLPVAFCGFLAVTRCWYLFASEAYSVGNFASAAELYAQAASMEMFNSEGWIKAYEAAYKDFEENGSDTLQLQKKYLQNAIKFNPDNCRYRELLSDSCSAQGSHDEALTIWDDIIRKEDSEYLYPAYAQKICNVMKYTSPHLVRMEELYGKIGNLANECTDKNIKLAVNNILTESQKYYVTAREGENPVADMYTYDYVYEPAEPDESESQMMEDIS